MPVEKLETQHRILHWVFKITDLRAWIEFSKELLHSRVYRHEEFQNGCEATCNGPYSGDWSKTMIGPSNEDHFCIELTYNYGIHEYTQGNELRYITLKYPNAAEEARKSKYPKEERQDGSVLVTGPDASKWLFISGESENGKDEPFYSVVFSSSNIEAGTQFYTEALGLSEFDHNGNKVFGYAAGQTKVELVQTPEVTHDTGKGRIAFATSSVPITYARALRHNTTIQNHPTTLPTPGKADVVVTILKDRDDIEICQVQGFDELCKLVDGADVIDWEFRDKKEAAVKKWAERAQN
ncbi:glyoxalase domain containing 4 [Planoprotostelium fungivorum]|uniref:Glyoxalase domain containing 4 n=1 Tax=Planoprotostelium fungivorum TaxID=1890364 RepID=A0A2P6N9J7_9EUKA|nr:glyoxalase domain containing 4 [Planoprotostelium fungivorum]